jgi:YHS domain-containing protein
LIRLLIIAGLVYFLYRKYRSWQESLADRREKGETAIEDIMVQDPHCGTYFPRREGAPLRFDGEDLLFCSKKCRDAFVAEHTNTTTGG